MIMKTKVQIRDIRQAQSIRRAKSARMYGRVLIPVTMIVLAQAIWSDPVLGPQVIASAEEAKPVLATYAQGTPLDGRFGPVPEAPVGETPSTADAEVSIEEEGTQNASFNLPNSTTPVNRPEG